MPISITPPANRGDQVRKLAARGLTAADIHELTGFPTAFVDRALAPSRPRPRVEATGPLTAGQIAERTGMPLAAAQLMVR